MTKEASYWLYQDEQTFTRQELNEYLAKKETNGKGRTGSDNSKPEPITEQVSLYQENN